MAPLDPWLLLSQLCTLLFTAFIAWLTYRSHLLLKEFNLDVNVLLSWPETVARTLMVGICLILAWMSGLTAEMLGLTVTNGWWSLGIGFVAGATTQWGLNLISQRAIRRFGRGVYSPTILNNILPKRRTEWLLVALAFIPPILMEELLFRSLLIGLFEEGIPLTLLILVTSTLFGLMHIPQGRLGIILAGTINVIFCVLFIWTGELLVTFVAHYTVNMMQLVTARSASFSKFLSEYDSDESP